MHARASALIKILILALCFAWSQGDCFARSLKEEMRWLFSNTSSVQSMVKRAAENPAAYSSEQWKTTLQKFAELKDSCTRMARLNPQASIHIPPAESAAFLEAYRARFTDLSGLFTRLETELNAQIAKDPEARNFQHAKAISEAITDCADFSHEDFKRATPVPSLHGNACKFPE